MTKISKRVRIAVSYSGHFFAEVDPGAVARRARMGGIGNSLLGAIEEAFNEEFRNLLPEFDYDGSDAESAASKALGLLPALERRAAILLCEIVASTPGFLVDYGWGSIPGATANVWQLASKAHAAARMALSATRHDSDDYLEAAALLRDGWCPGDAVLLLGGAS